MKGVTSIALALIGSLCLAQQTILIGGTRCTKYGPSLQKLLGPEYRVMDISHSRAARGTHKDALMMIDDFTPPSDRSWLSWSQHEDAFVTRVRFDVIAGTNLVSRQDHYRILLP